MHRARVVDQRAVLGWLQTLNPLGSIASVLFSISIMGVPVVSNITSPVTLAMLNIILPMGSKKLVLVSFESLPSGKHVFVATGPQG